MRSRRIILNVRIALYYAAGTAVLLVLAVFWWPWSAVLIWPAVSMCVITAGYLGLGHRIYCKRGGRISIAARVVLWPVLVGHVISRWHYRRLGSAYDRLSERVWIGARLTDAEARQIVEEGVTAVIDLAAESSEVRPLREVAYLQMSVLDLTAPTMEQLERAVAFINAQAERGIVYVHCKAGYSRTAAVAGAWLMASGRAKGVEEAVAMMKTARRGMIVRPEIIAALRAYRPRLS